jgi:acyl-CoA dehydrogenase
VLAYGQEGGALGELIGEENRGLEYMFIMMNAARFAVGLEGIGLSERAFQAALAFANERIQGMEPGAKGRVPIARHPDIRRMLMLIKSKTEAMRALASVAAVSLDAARAHPDEKERGRHQAFADLMIPVVKGWCTENSVALTSLAIQVHGGMGFIEETGVAQLYRDARITPIYEGTTGIQANDLVGRKIARDGGRTAQAVIEEMRKLRPELAKEPSLGGAERVFSASIDALESAARYVVAGYGKNTRAVSAGAVPLLELFGVVAGGWQLLRSALVARDRIASPPAQGAASAAFYRAKIETARFYADHVLPQAPALAHAIIEGSAGVLAEGVL